MSEGIWIALNLLRYTMEASLFLLLINRKLGVNWDNIRRDFLFVAVSATILTAGFCFTWPSELLLAVGYMLALAYSIVYKPGQLKDRILWPTYTLLLFYAGSALLSLWVATIPQLNWEILGSHDTVRLMMWLYYALLEIVVFLLLAKPGLVGAVIPRWIYPLLYATALAALAFGGILLDQTPRILTNPEFARVLILCFIGLFGITISSFFIFDRLVLWVGRAFELQSQVVRVSEEQKDLRNLLDGYDNLRGFWHDIKQHFANLFGLAHNDQYAEMKRYLVEALQQEFIPLQDLLFSGNPHLDALLFVKSQQARRLGVEIERKLIVPEQIPFSDSDFVAILGNIIDNALEASAKVPPEKRFLKLYATLNKGMWLIEVSNSSDGVYRRRGDNELASTKPGPWHGIGLSRIRNMVTAYGGLVEVEAEEERFTVRLHIPIARNREAEMA